MGLIGIGQATLDVGARIDYDPREFPELRSRDFADTRQYVALVGPLTQLLETELEIPSIRAEPVWILVWRKLRTLGRKNCLSLWLLLTDPAQRGGPAQEYRHPRFPNGLPKESFPTEPSPKDGCDEMPYAFRPY